MFQWTQFIVHVVVLLLSTLSFCSAENVYCIRPTGTSCSPCPHKTIHCATLSEYAQQAKLYFTSNSTMVFLPGDHTLDMNITVTNISRLMMCGETSSGYLATVVCNGPVGLSFMSMVDFKIHYLTFTACGRSFDEYYRYTLLLESIQYAEIVNCSFHDNFGTALVVYQTSVTLAENNEFTHNHCNKGFMANYCVGGGGITAHYSNLTFTGNTTFLHNYAMFGSPGILVINCSLSSTGSIHFTNNSVTLPLFQASQNALSIRSGVAIWASASSLNITGTSNFINNSAYYGDAIYAVDNTSLSFTGTTNFINNSADYGGAIYAKNTLLSFTGTSNFISNSADYGGAIFADNTSLSFTGTNNFINNSADYHGGAIYAKNTLLSFTGTSNFISNSADYGGAIFANHKTSLTFKGTSNFINNSADGDDGGAIYAVDNTSLSFTGTTNFIHNSAAVWGGAITANLNTLVSFTGTCNLTNNSADYGGGAILAEVASLSFTGTISFISNSATNGGGAIVAENASSSFTGTNNFINNSAAVWGGAIIVKHNTSFTFNGTNNFINNLAHYGGGAIVADNDTLVSFVGTSNFISNLAANGGGAIVANVASLRFSGTSNFINNSAKYWGGGAFLKNSIFSISPNTTVCWESNYASSGGAIYNKDYNPLVYCTEFDTCTIKDECFFQLPGQNLSNGIDAQFVFKDNSADAAGSVLYGGAIDNCKLTGLESSNYSSGEVFDMLVHVDKGNTNSIISSKPFRICPCENNHPDCSRSNKSYAVYPGETFYVSVVAVGQKNGTAPTIVRGHLTSSDTGLIPTPIGNLHSLQYLQATFNTCTILNYTVFSLFDSILLELYADGPCSIFSNKLDLTLDVNRACPPGFNLSQIERSCVCNQRLAKYTSKCDISNGVGQIKRQSLSLYWVGYDNESNALILHPYCPFHYCVFHTVDFPLNNTDLQCAHNRSGLLCGACKEGYSLLLGSSQCKQCTNINLFLLIPFALMGLALVFFLLVSKLTVATGTLSGLVFYANIVGINRTTFTPVESTNILSVFIAWLNLDFGVETCFYKEMDAYSKTWLQFVFPVYIWVIVGFIILASHFSHRFTKLLGSNPVSVLATLILLSYTKILQNLIAAIYITYLDYPTYRRGVWLYDANIDYLSIKHTPLFVLAILVFVFLFIPYTLLLLFGQWLQAISHLRLFAWVNSARLKIFMDSYHAPYKARHRYWPGLLLVLRFILVIVFALNPQQDPSINLLAILVGTGFLQLWAWASGGVYKNSYLDALEGLFFLNLVILVGSTAYVNHSGGNQLAVEWNLLAVGYTSITIALVTFIGILGFQLADTTGIIQCLQKKFTDLKWYTMANELIHQTEAEVESESDTDSLPDRLVNPNEYEPFSHPAQEHRVAEPTEVVNEERRRLIPVYTYGSIN